MTGGRIRLSDDEITLLRHVFRATATTRAALKTMTGFSKSKTNTGICELEGLGLLAEIPGANSTGGRRSALIQMSKGWGTFASVSLNASRVALAAFDPNLGKLAEAVIQLSNLGDVENSLAEIAEAWRGITLARSMPRAVALGVAVAGPVDLSSGTLVAPPLMPKWAGVDIASRLGARIDLPVFVANDANAMALAYAMQEKAFDKDLVVVNVSLGIGSGIVSNGRLHVGNDGSAGDIGHITVDRAGARCRCGNCGCLVLSASGVALAKQYLTSRGTDLEDYEIIARGLMPQALDGIREAALNGDADQILAIRRAGHDLGLVLATVVNIVNPARIVLTGPGLSVGPGLLSAVRESVYRHARPLATRELSITDHGDGDKLALFGSAMVAFDGLLNVIVASGGRMPEHVLSNLGGRNKAERSGLRIVGHG